ncbi:MAG: sensor histidine kinase [Anaerolineae bacterium]|nr:sensor histidine kinase [Anaerolineae bacterium]
MPTANILTRDLIFIFFLYGLAFFSMGLAVLLESGRASEFRFARTMRPLAGFGIVHGAHEWFEMFQKITALRAGGYVPPVWVEVVRLVLLSVSFMFLAAFGARLIHREERPSWVAYHPAIILTIVWIGSVVAVRVLLRPSVADWLAATDVLSRYTLGIPGALLASWALVLQQRIFRERGMAGFGRDLLWSALAFFWYGVAGQLFTRSSILFPSTILNGDLFIRLFGFPVQLFRAVTASVVAIFIIRALRAFEIESRQILAAANEAKLLAQQEALEAQRRVQEETARLYAESQARAKERDELLHQVVSAQEAERQRIARELHDETSQSLTALAMGLKGVEQSLQADPQLAQKQLAELKSLSVHSLDTLRQIMSDLRPSVLDDLGLVAALRWYVDEVRKRAPVKIEILVKGARRRLEPQVETVLFRIAQEALTNVVRHAQARLATVAIHFADSEVRLLVMDDGRGFVPDEILRPGLPRQAWGLLGLQERAALVGGSCSIRSKPGHGTEIMVTIPLARQELGDGRITDSPAAG